MNENILQLWNDGLTIGEITEQLGCSGQQVYTVLAPVIKAATYGL